MIGSTRTRTGAATVALALSSAALLGACGSSGGSDPAGSTTATTTTTADTSETTATTSADTTTTVSGSTTTMTGADADTETTKLGTLPDGDHYGYMTGLETGTVEGQDVQVILWDEVEFLTGQQAIAAAAADNVTLDTDYYIRNKNQMIRHLAVVPEASVSTLQEGSSGSKPSSVDEVSQQEYLFKINVGNVRGITTVSGIDAVYLP